MTRKQELLDEAKAVLISALQAKGETSTAIAYAQMYGICSQFLTEKQCKAVLEVAQEIARKG